MIFLERPNDFKPIFEVVGCYCEHEGKILLLHRQDHKPMGNTWCVPGGKVEQDEKTRFATIREVFQETGLILGFEDLERVITVYVRYDEYDFIYHLYKASVLQRKVQLNHDEHKDYRWVSPTEALLMNLIQDEEACLRIAFDL